MPQPTKQEVRAAAAEIIRRWGLGTFSSKKRPREKRRRFRGAINSPLGPAKPEPSTNFVYAICGDEGPVKIGITKDVAKRLSGLQTGHPHRLRVFFAAPMEDAVAARSVEKSCHARLSASRLSGEWFAIDPYEAAGVIQQIIAARAELFSPPES